MYRNLDFSRINGALDGRWADESDLQAHGMLLQQIPKDVGDWILTDEVFETNAQRCSNATGHLPGTTVTASLVTKSARC